MKDQNKTKSQLISELNELRHKRNNLAHSNEVITESELKYKALIDAFPDIILISDYEGKLLFANHALEEQTGLTFDDLQNQRNKNPFIHPEDKDRVQAFIYKFIKSKKRHSKIIENRLIDKFGKLHWYSGKISKIKYNGKPAILVISRDITDKVLMEQSKDEAYKIIEGSPAAVFLWKNEKKWPVEFVTENIKTLLGYTSKDFTSGRIKYTNIVHKDDIKRVTAEVIYYSKNKNIKEFVHKPYRLVSKNNREIWIDDRTYIVRDDSGNISHYQGIVLDISDRVKSQEAIRKLSTDRAALLEISKSLTKSLNMNIVLQNIIDRSTRLIGLDTGAIYIINKDELYLGAASPRIPSEFPEKYRRTHIDEHPNIQKAINSGKPFFLPDLKLAKLSPAEEAIRKSRHLRSTIYVPLMIKKRAVGILILGTTRKTKTYSKIDIKMYSSISNQIALAIENARLFDKTNHYVTELKQTIADCKVVEENLKESERRFRSLVEQSPYGIQVYEPDGTLTQVNKAWEKLWSANAKNVVGTFNPLKDAQIKKSGVLPLIKKSFAGETVSLPDTFFDPKTSGLPGRERWLRTHAYAVKNKNGKIQNVVVVNQDITQLKEAEQALHQSEEKFRRIADNAPDIIYRFRMKPDPGFDFISHAVKKITGYSAQEHYNNPDLGINLVHPDDRPKLNALYHGIIPKKPHIVRWIRKDGRIIWTEDRITPIYNNGELVAIEGIARDITKQKEIASKLQESEKRFRTMFETNHAIMMLIDPENQKVVNANPAACKFYGYSHKKFINDIFISDINTLSEKQIKIEMDKALKEKRNYFVFKHKLRNGKIRDVEVYSSKTTINEKELLYSIVHDITDRKRAEEALRKSEDSYRQISEVASDYAFSSTVNDEGNLELNWVVGAFETITGYTYEEYIACGGWRSTIHPDDLDRDARDMQQLNQNQNVTTEIRTIKKDGSIVWVQVIAQPVWDEQSNKLIGIYGAVQNINDRKMTEVSLRESEQKFREMADLLPQIVFETDLGGTITFVNKQAFKTFGYAENELGQNFNVINNIVPDQRDIALENIQKTIEGKTVDQIEYNLLKKDGTIFPALIYSSPVIKENKPVGLRGIIVDISERKETEEALLMKDFAVASSINGIGITDLNGILIYVNDAAEKMWGYNSRDEILGHSLIEFWEGDGIYQTMEDLKSKGFRFGEDIGKRKDGSLFPIQFSASIVKDNNGNPKYIFGSFIDITERKQTEEALKESEEKYRLIVENAHDGIEITQDDHLIFANSCFADMLGYSTEELKKLPFSQFFTDQAKQDLNERHKKRQKGLPFINQYETTFRKKDGSIIDVDVKHEIIDYKGKPATFAIIRDITRQKQSEEEKNILEKQLRHSQKLETIGTLAGGIAHDFNNILAPIMGYTDMAIHKLDRSNPLYDDMQNVLKSAHRAKELVEQILLFSKQSEKERQQIELQSLVKEALKLIRPTIPTTINIVQKIDSSCGKIYADATQIHQVIINLCTNAWQAMEEKGGILTIEMIQTKIDATFAKLHPNLNQDDYVRLSIMDTGPGMDDETLERIFEPFFTTKAVDKGTGLGLSVVHGIVRGHKGDIFVQSEIGKGTSFHVYLPVIKKENIQKNSKPLEITGGSEFVLIVDDETAIAEMVKRMLENFGYKGEIHTNGLSALKAFNNNPEKYDLIITDLTMPQITGLELADKIHEIQKNFPVLIMTGYGDSITMGTQERHGISQVIGKPIVIQDLTNAVRKIFDN